MDACMIGSNVFICNSLNIDLRLPSIKNRIEYTQKHLDNFQAIFNIKLSYACMYVCMYERSTFGDDYDSIFKHSTPSSPHLFLSPNHLLSAHCFHQRWPGCFLQ